MTSLMGSLSRLFGLEAKNPLKRRARYAGEKMKVRNLVVGMLGLAAILLLSGCAVGNKHNYHESIAHIEAANDLSFAVAAQDQRPYVLSGNKAPNFVGLQRGGFGNPFDVTTESGNPLADDIAASVARSISESGANVSTVSVSPSLSQEQAVYELKSTGADRLLLLIFTEWKTDTFNNTALLYDMTAYVRDAEGRPIAESAIRGRDNLGGSMFNPPSHAKSAVPLAFRKKIEELLNSHQVAGALK